MDEQEYLTDAIGREAVSFVERHAAEPFLLQVTFNAVHAPLQAPAKYLDRFKNISDERHQTYAAMLSALDDNVGRVLSAVHDKKLDEDTLVFFISDNGGPPQANTSNNAPLAGSKGSVWEGGIRVPFLLRWTGHVPAGAVYAEPVISLDISATAAAVAAQTGEWQADRRRGPAAVRHRQSTRNAAQAALLAVRRAVGRSPGKLQASENGRLAAAALRPGERHRRGT